jgi:hypothetical protein
MHIHDGLDWRFWFQSNRALNQPAHVWSWSRGQARWSNLSRLSGTHDVGPECPMPAADSLGTVGTCACVEFAISHLSSRGELGGLSTRDENTTKPMAVESAASTADSLLSTMNTTTLR